MHYCCLLCAPHLWNFFDLLHVQISTFTTSMFDYSLPPRSPWKFWHSDVPLAIIIRACQIWQENPSHLKSAAVLQLNRTMFCLACCNACWELWQFMTILTFSSKEVVLLNPYQLRVLSKWVESLKRFMAVSLYVCLRNEKKKAASFAMVRHNI